MRNRKNISKTDLKTLRLHYQEFFLPLQFCAMSLESSLSKEANTKRYKKNVRVHKNGRTTTTCENYVF